jgi:ubiquinone/menaquinone biosynthesis C-methylase UbiE
VTYKLKTGYQDESVAAAYHDKRFSHPKGKRENEETLSALAKALDAVPGTKTILDMPCGSGRLTEFLYDKGHSYFGADISLEMMNVLAEKQTAKGRSPALIRCDGEALPFKDDAFDCVVCFRFFNVQRIPKSVREAILKEIRRISKQWLILQGKDLKFQSPFVRFKVFLRKMVGKEVAKYQFENELSEAGWREERRVWIRAINRYIGVYQKTAQFETVPE